MHYIVFDLEFNQDFPSLQNFDRKNSRYPFEIIQIGAIKLDEHFNTIATFNRYVKPSFYTQINPFITELTGITTNQLLLEEPFPEVYKAYTEFIGGGILYFVSGVCLISRNYLEMLSIISSATSFYLECLLIFSPMFPYI